MYTFGYTVPIPPLPCEGLTASLPCREACIARAAPSSMLCACPARRNASPAMAAAAAAPSASCRGAGVRPAAMEGELGSTWLPCTFLALQGSRMGKVQP